jgi:hypothetical protein
MLFFNRIFCYFYDKKTKNYLVNYNKLDSYPKISLPVDLILINLAQFNTNIIQYINKIQFKKIILIICNLSETKLQLPSDKFKILKIKYFKNYDNLIRIILAEKICFLDNICFIFMSIYNYIFFIV